MICIYDMYLHVYIYIYDVCGDMMKEMYVMCGDVTYMIYNWWAHLFVVYVSSPPDIASLLGRRIRHGDRLYENLAERHGQPHGEAY